MKTSITTDIEHCQALLREGHLVAIPTETVYGLAANALDSEAVKRIFEMKGRPAFNPLIVHIHQMDQLPILAKDIPQKAYDLAEAFWPGSLTLILPKQDIVPEIISGGKPTVGVRMPRHPLTQALLKGLPFPLAAPSANPFTRVSPTAAQHVWDYFGDRIPAILDGGPCQVGLESTIVGFEGETPILYRKGGIPKEAIEAVVGELRVSTENETSPEAPGMLLKHYSPRTPLMVCDDIKEALKQHSEKSIGVLSFFEEDFPSATKVIALSKNKVMEEAAMSLFGALHILDASGLDLILAERFPEKGLGSSINDRLFRAQN